MRIGLDFRMLGGGSGIDRYISELSHEILKQDKKNQYVLFLRNADESAGYKDYGHKIVVADTPHYSVAEQLKLPAILRKEQLDLMHFPHFNVPIFYRKPFVVTIHDLTHTQFPGRKKSRWLFRMAYHLVISNAIKNSKKIITITNAIKREIIEYFKVPESKIEVIYEAVNPNFKMMDKAEARQHVSDRFGISKPYILYVGVWRRYKNLESLAAAFNKLREQGLNYELVLAGEPDPFYPDIKEKVMDIKHSHDLKILGRVPEQDLPYLYNAAELLVLPSFAEGFGLTPLEAASCGIPVACSDIPVLHEVMGSGAAYFDPKNMDNMAEVISGILTNPKKAEDLANQALGRIKHFSWKKAAEETIRVYESVLT